MHWRTLSTTCFALFAGLIIFVSLAQSVYTWDLVAYVMATLDDGTKSPQALHGETWAVVKNHVPSSSMGSLLNGHYNEVQHRDPQALASMLPMYTMKIGYIYLLKVLAPLINPVHAMMVLSGLGAVGIVFVLYRASLGLDGGLVLLWLPLAGVLGIFHLAQLATPDALAAFLYAAGFWLMLTKCRSWSTVFFLLGVAIRPDNVLLNVLIAVTLAKKSWWTAAVLFGATCAVYLLGVTWAGHIGWWPHFYTSLVDQQTSLVGFNPHFDPLLYAKALIQQTSILAVSPWVYAILFVVGTCVALKANAGKDTRMIFLAIFVGGAIHYFVFPTHQQRNHAPYTFGVAVVMLSLLNQRASERSKEAVVSGASRL